MTATKADPVSDARDALDAAARGVQEAQQHSDALRARILDGDQAVTAKQLADAGHALERAALDVEAANLRLQAAQREARLNRLHALAAEITATAGDPDAALDAMNAITEAVRVLLVADANRRRNLTGWIAAARREGVPAFDPLGKPRTDAQGRTKTPYKTLSAEHGHIGWQEAFMGRGDVLYAAGRKITDHNPGALIRAAIERGCAQAGGRGADWLGLDQRAPEQITADPEGWIRANY